CGWHPREAQAYYRGRGHGTILCRDGPPRQPPVSVDALEVEREVRRENGDRPDRERPGGRREQKWREPEQVPRIDRGGEREGGGKGECCGRTLPARQCPRRGDDGERAEEIDVAVARAFEGDERVPRVREAPPRAPPRGGEEAQDDEDHERVAHRERPLHRARGLLD